MGRGFARLLLLLLVCVGPTVAAEAGPGAAHRIFQWRPFLAPFHSVVLHFPIGFLTMAGILELYRAFRPNQELRRVTVLVVWLSLVAGLVSAGLGVMRAGGGGYEPRAVELHRAFGLAVPAFTMLALALQQVAYRNEARRRWTHAYRAALLCTLGLLVAAGHLGGNLTHGSKYLTANAPEFVRDLLEEDAPALAAGVPGHELGQQERSYAENIQPVLASKCYQCHGSEKQKGGYRLDQPEDARKGGDSGKPAIKPGDVLGSQLAQRILLPPQHDDVMPPEGKEPLSLEEIGMLLDWIRNGAVFPSGSKGPLAGGPATR
jgi:uncharacterized membrane protein